MEKRRCGWCNLNSPEYVDYHDSQWGVPVHDDRLLFEMLSLEGMQAGLSWISILQRRDNYREAFDDFDYHKIAGYGQQKEDELLADTGIIRNKLKIKSIVGNARAFIRIREEFGSFAHYIWEYVDFTPIHTSCAHFKDMPVKTELSERITKDLKKRGMKFVGPVIIYSLMQAIGMINDHETTCFRHAEIMEQYRG